ncbi:MAG: hypothetical protein HYS14_12040, partial [Candidatus Rokubacteria bacterium]|nr:hypothetical protein [Candidatus Rokubacteria bacterium]
MTALGRILTFLILGLSLDLDAGPVTAATDKLRVGYVHVFDDAPVVIARDAGFFAAQGL